MTILQKISIVSSFLFLLLLQFTCNLTPPSHTQIQQSRNISAISTDIDNIILKATKTLTPPQKNQIIQLQSIIDHQNPDSIDTNSLERLASLWYSFDQPAISGHYAEAIAIENNNEDAWSIAGTTYSICLKQDQIEQDIRSYCYKHAVQSFENAISLNPENANHKLNLAILYTDNPPKENPMKGILMLRELNEKHPQNTSVLNNLGRLSIQTGQYQNALKRLNQSIQIDPENNKAYCLMALTYQKLNDSINSKKYAQLCSIK